MQGGGEDGGAAGSISIKIDGEPAGEANPVPIRVVAFGADDDMPVGLGWDAGGAGTGLAGGVMGAIGGALGLKGKAMDVLRAKGSTDSTAYAPGGGMSSDYSGIPLAGAQAVSGGPAAAGLLALARHEVATERVSAFHAFHDRFHIFENPGSAHNRGLAFDMSTIDGNYEAARQRVRAHLTGLGMVEGAHGGGGDFWIEPGTGNHLHVQFNSMSSANRYLELTRGSRAPMLGGNGRGVPPTGATLLHRRRSPAGGASIQSPVTNHIAIYGVSDPHKAASLVGMEVDRSHQDHVSALRRTRIG